jgi:hypothetical protein
MSKRGNPNLAQSRRTPLRTGVNTALNNALFNDIDSRFTLQKEKPVHRRMAELALQGYRNEEIGEMLGYTRNGVSIALKQPFSRQYMIEAAKRTANDEIQELLKTAAVEAVERITRMAELVDEHGKPIHAKAYEANVYLVDRLLGKATQPFRDESTPVKKLTDEQLEREISRVLTRTEETS